MNNKQQLDKLVEIEDKCFTYDKISRRSFKHFLEKNEHHGCSIQDYGYILIRLYKNICKIYSIAILPEYRGKGLGKEFILKAIEYTRLKKRKELHLECKEELKEFYTKLGFEEYGRKENYYEDGSSAVKFIKKIG